MFQKRWGFGLGTIFSLIVVYFIFLYSREKGWVLLTLISKWYLIIAGILIALPLGIVFVVLLVMLLVFLISMLKLHSFGKKHKNKKSKEYVDVEYTIKE